MNRIGKDPEEIFDNEPKDRIEKIRDLLKEKRELEEKIRTEQRKLREERNIEPESKKHPIKRLKSAFGGSVQRVKSTIQKGISALKQGWQIVRE
ncbi:MAG: hypothetical protein ACLFT7_08685 [Thermoplasmata archaeon]